MVGRDNSFVSRRRAWAVLGAVAVFVAVALFLLFLMARVVFVMRDTANDIDNRRAVDAARAAIGSVERRLLGTIRDNAVWDDAFIALNSDDYQAWVWKNWGSISADYPLYDGLVVTAADGRQLAGFLKGEAAQIVEMLGPALARQVVGASAEGEKAFSGAYKLGDRLLLTGSQAVRSEDSVVAGGGFKVLTMFKIVTPELLAAISKDYQLEGLTLSDSPASGGSLDLAVKGTEGEMLAYLVWPELLPGSRLYEEVRPTLLDAAFVFFLLLSTILIGGYSEVRALRRLAASADHDATHDTLSGLLNRSGLIRSLEARLARRGDNASLALYLIDLDGFKAVNDTWGHGAGDRLIGAVASRLSTCHAGIAFAARLGGDEFALACDLKVDPRQVAKAALEALLDPFQIDGHTIEVGASIGYVVAEPGTVVLELLRRADMALYEVKERGRGHALAYSEELDRERARTASAEADLRKALDEGLLGVVFQPLVSCVTGKLEGVEALARWNGPEGPVPPDTFVALAEKAGLINRLGKFVLETAMEFARHRPGLELSVNVSPLQLCHPDFPREVIDILSRETFDPRNLILEVTEGVLIESPDQARRSIEALRAKGVRFALDDFGVGYASIGALRHFGFDRMKIDRSLIWAADKESGRHVLNATISLANALNIPVTAEGVETSDQAELVRQTGCELMQGYLLGRPMSARDFDSFRESLAGAA